HKQDTSRRLLALGVHQPSHTSLVQQHRLSYRDRPHAHSARVACQSTSQAGSHFRTGIKTCASVPSAYPTTAVTVAASPSFSTSTILRCAAFGLSRKHRPISSRSSSPSWTHSPRSFLSVANRK